MTTCYKNATASKAKLFERLLLAERKKVKELNKVLRTAIKVIEFYSNEDNFKGRSNMNNKAERWLDKYND